MNLKPLGQKLIVKRYLKPEMVKGIIIPETHQADDTRSLWEFVRGTEKAFEFIGERVREGDLLQTPPMRGIYMDTFKGEDHFVIDAAEVIRIIRY